MGFPVDASRVEYSGVPRRLVAYTLDIGIVLAVTFLSTTVIGLLLLGSVWWASPWSDPVARWQPGAGERYLAYLVLTNLGSAAIELVYFAWFWTRGAGSTPGMRVLRLRIVRAADGGLVTRGAAVRRWLVMGSWLLPLTAVPGIDNLVFVVWLAYLAVLVGSTLWSPLRRGLHDRAGGSVVLEPAPKTGHPLAIGCLAVVVLWALLMNGMLYLITGPH